MSRKPAVAGMFYPGKADELQQQVDGFLEPTSDKQNAYAIMVPHAGYIYSGHVAGITFSSVKLPERFVILCPNHTWLGGTAAIMTEGSWRTPLGEAPIDSALASEILRHSKILCEDARAHTSEHSLEVQLPFLQRLRPDFRFVPISVRTHEPDDLQEIASAIAEVVDSSDNEVMLVASTDMTHQESQKSAERKDRLAIDEIERLDPLKLLKVVKENDISMCGVAPTACVMLAAKALGATKGQLLKYSTSAETTGDYDRVVGYAGAMFV
ncbi:AmmeMemoRadiSam system protein B [Acidobacteriota bacterium]